ncbi:hypothetical protein DB346_24155 [Verrucomicrobia bacterium LW23]|nr:hypothetical protein DB346_24155 [Verrucomicrobia bacterium LW23]
MSGGAAASGFVSRFSLWRGFAAVALALTLALALMPAAHLRAQHALGEGNVAAPPPGSVPSPALAEPSAAPPGAEPAPSPAGEPAPAPAAPQPAAPQSAAPAPARGAGGALRVLAPAEHMPAWLRTQIQARTGAAVTLDAYKTDGEALQKAAQSNPPYDLIAVSDRVAAELVKQRKLSTVTWPVNKDTVYARYRGHYFDQDNHMTLAYAMSMSGYAYKISDFPKPPGGWQDVLGGDLAGVSWKQDQAWRRTLLAVAGQQAAPGDARLTAAPATTGRLVVDSVPELCRRFGADSRNWKIVLPGSGSVITLYQVAIPVGAPRPREALAAVQVLFTPQVMAKLSTETLTAVTMPAAYKMLPPQYATHPLLYPSQNAMDNSVFVKMTR